MVQIAFIYGAIGGAIAVGAIVVSLLFGGDHGGGSLAFGYAVMIVALTLIFLGVKRYRDRDLGGVIKFAPALGLGLMIATVAGAFYALGWEGYLAATDYKFMPEYVAAAIAKQEAAGVTGAELKQFTDGLKAMEESYKNPVYRFGMTFIEIFPVGVIIALISAALLRNPRFLPARGAA